MATSQDPLLWQRQFCRGQRKEQNREEDGRRGGGQLQKLIGMGFGDFLRAQEDREMWKGIVVTSSTVPLQP